MVLELLSNLVRLGGRRGARGELRVYGLGTVGQVLAFLSERRDIVIFKLSFW